MEICTFEVLLGDPLVRVEVMWHSWVFLFWILYRIGIVVPRFYGHVLCLRCKKTISSTTQLLEQWNHSNIEDCNMVSWKYWRLEKMRLLTY